MRRFLRDARVATLVSFALALVLYATTAARTAQGGDTAEFAWLAYAGGVAHPPGYPIYSLLVRLFALLPFGAPFFSIALTSVVAGAGTVALLQHLGARLTRRPWLAALGALVFAVSSPQWKLSGVPEVFELNAFMALLLALCSLRLAEAEERHVLREGLVVGLVFGLGLANHQTLVLCLPLPLAALVAVGRRFGWGGVARAAMMNVVGGLVGLSAYLILLVTSRTTSPEALVWGEPRTLPALLNHLLRKEYGTFKLYSGMGQSSSPLHGIGFFLQHLGSGFAYVFALVGLAGMVVGWQRFRGQSMAVLAALFLSGFLFLSLQNIPPGGDHIVARFHLLPMTLFAPFVALGLAWAAERISLAAVGAVAALGLALSVSLHLTEANWRADTSVERATIGLLTPLEPNAIVLGTGDHLLFGTGWVTQVLKIRPDVHYVDIGLIVHRWYYDRVVREIPGFPMPFSETPVPLAELASRLQRIAPTYVTLGLPELEVKSALQLEPVGFVEQVVAPGSPHLLPEAVQQRLEAATAAFGAQPPPIDNWSWDVHDHIGLMWSRLAAQWDAAQQPERARACHLRAAEILPDSGP